MRWAWDVTSSQTAPRRTSRPLSLQLCGLDLVVMAPLVPEVHVALPGLDPFAHQPLPFDDTDELSREVDDDQAGLLVQALARALLEVLQARRPTAQLRTLCEGPAVDYALAWSRRREWRGSSIASVRANLVGEAVEGSVRIADEDGRSMALALRAERLGGRWRCTCFGMLAPGARLTERFADDHARAA